MNNDEITNKILESGFIEAFFEQYFQHLDWEYTEKENVEIILCTSNKEKQKVIKQLIKGYKEKIRLLGFNSLSSNFLENTNIDAHLEFISFIKSSIESFKPINMFLNQISNGMQSSNNDLDLENIYLFNYPNEWKPKSKKLFEILEQERFLIEDINIIIEHYNNNSEWDFNYEDFENYYKYSLPIQKLFDVCELFIVLVHSIKMLDLLNVKKDKEKNKSFDNVKKIDNSDKTNLVDDLLIFSSTVLKVTVFNYSKEQIIIFDKRNNYSDYLDYENSVFQSAIIKADVKQINLILGNLERAIKTNCFNSIDLRGIKLNENFYYANSSETIPEDLQEFRIQYLKYLIKDLRKIDFNIRKFLNLPIVQHKEFIKRDILKEFDEYSKFESDYLIKIKEVLKVDNDKLKIYFKEYLEKTDSFLQLFDEMQNTFYSDVGYYNEEDKNLKGILKGCKSLLISNLFEIINAKSINNDDKNILDKVIKDYEFSLKVYETKSNFIELIKDKLSDIVISNIENKLSDINIHSIYIGDKMLHYLDCHSITIEEAALYCVYQSIEVDDKNCDEIINFFKNTSGRKLYQYFANYSVTDNRRNNNLNSKTKLKNRIEKIKKILNLLDDNYKIHADKDLIYLNEKLDSEYN